MANEISNYGRFYAAVRQLNPIGDRDDFKRLLVSQYTDGRTDSLREMTRAEYDRCCADLERRNGRREELRRQRSATLRLMQKLGIDTTDWARINSFTRDPRIAGCDFARISPEGHAELQRKLRAISRKGGLAGESTHATGQTPPQQVHREMPKVTVLPVGTLAGNA